MNETHVTVTGNVASAIDYRTSATTGVPVARFRIASTVRRFDRQRESWSDAFTSFYTVWAWRSLAANVASSVTVGEPVIVTGQVRIKETDKEGKHFLSADLMASAIGHDLSRGTSAFARVSAARPELVPRPGSTSGDTAGRGSVRVAEDGPGVGAGAGTEAGAGVRAGADAGQVADWSTAQATGQAAAERIDPWAGVTTRVPGP
jgi:single-strand DNA-binding protein